MMMCYLHTQNISCDGRRWRWTLNMMEKKIGEERKKRTSTGFSSLWIENSFEKVFPVLARRWCHWHGVVVGPVFFGQPPPKKVQLRFKAFKIYRKSSSERICICDSPPPPSNKPNIYSRCSYSPLYGRLNGHFRVPAVFGPKRINCLLSCICFFFAWWPHRLTLAAYILNYIRLRIRTNT